MKRVFIIIAAVFLVSTAAVSDRNRVTWTPVFMSRASLDNSVKYIAGARDMHQTGKIYCRAPYIFMCERYKGVHVINNTDPALPVSEGFILAPGCIDMAVKGNILYLDNAVDLVAFDLDTKQVTSRICNVFPEPASPDGQFYHSYSNRPEGYILVEWKKEIIN